MVMVAGTFSSYYIVMWGHYRGATQLIRIVLRILWIPVILVAVPRSARKNEGYL